MAYYYSKYSTVMVLQYVTVLFSSRLVSHSNTRLPSIWRGRSGDCLAKVWLGTG
jgi:hypothetical protein